MQKIIRKSNRGLTFTAPDFSIGQKYNYLVDKRNNEIHIIPSEGGRMTVSRKKSGKSFIPLIDIRSREVREAMASADYLELELLNSGDILVRTVKKNEQKEKDNLVSIRDVIGKNVYQVIIPERMLAVSGGNYPEKIFGRPTLANDAYFEYLSSCTGRKKNPSRKDIGRVYDVISLFSGAGMLDKAFMDGRFRFVYGIDFNKAAVNTYRENIGNHIICGDIRDVEASSIPEADVVIGGPCCQAYSNENRHNIDSAEGETKRLLVDDYCRIVSEKHVKVWAIENVPELLTKTQGFYLQRICEKLSDYEITAAVLTDYECGGYSTRKRAIVIGSRIGKIEFPNIKAATLKTVRDALNKVDATWFNYEDVTLPKPVTRKKMSYVPQGGNWKDIPPELNSYGEKTHSCVMRRLEWDKPAITLCNFRKSNILHPEENRILTVSEAAAVMGLDKSFRFLGTLAEKQQMVANGVTQAIGKFVKNVILRCLDTCIPMA